MLEPRLPADEARRIMALHNLGILDTPPEERFDLITRLAQRIFDVPIALISLVDSHRQWFKSCQGLSASETPRNISFCGHAILGSRIFVVADTLEDVRFADNPLVSGEPRIRFYAGCPLSGQNGQKLGTLCIIDRRPRTFTDVELTALADLAHLVERELNERDLAEVTTALLDSEKRLNLALESSGIALWEWDITSGAALLSGQWALMLGENPEPVATTIEALTELTHPDDRGWVRQAILTVIKGTVSVYRTEHRVRHRDGRWLWIQSIGKIIERDADGKALRMTGTNADITARHEIDLALERQHNALRALNEIEALPELDAQNQLQQALALGAKYLQAEFAIVSHIEGDHYTIVAHSSPPGTLQDGQTFPLGQTYCSITLNANDVLTIAHMQRSPYNRHPCYSAFRLESYIGAPVMVDGRPTGTVNFSSSARRERDYDATDIEFVRLLARWVGSVLERNRALQLLYSTMEIQRAILDGTNYSIISTDPDGTILTFNRAAELMLGYAASDVVRKVTPAILHDPGEVVARAASLSTELGQTIEPGFEVFVAKSRRGVAEELEWTYLHKDGRRIPVLLSVTALRDAQGTITGFLGIASDISARKRAEQALTASEARFRSVITSMAEGVVVQDRQSQIISCNASAERILGLSRDQILGRTSIDPRWHAIHTDGSDYPGDEHPAMVTLRTAEAQSDVVMGICKPDGSTSWISINTQPIVEPGATVPETVVASFHDITARLAAEAELRESAQRIKSIVDTVADGLLTISDHGLVESFNPAAERIFGYDATEAIGQHIKMLLAEPYRSLEDGYLEHYRSSGEHRSLGTGRETVGRRKDGSTFPLELAVSEMWLGERRLFTGLARDVTTRKRAEEDLRRFKSTLDNTLDMIFMFEPESLRFVYLNRGAVESMGYSRAELLAMTPYQIKPLMTESAFRKFIAPLLSGESHTLNFETVHRRKDGTDFPVEIFLQLVREPGERGLFVAMVRDITARKKVDRMKNEFISTVSHELRTPLTSIRGSLGLIAGGVAGVIPPQAQELVGIAYKNSERLTRLINDILDIEKIESGKMKFDMKPVELMPLVEQAMEANRGYATELGVSIQIKQDLPGAQVFADPERLMQVMANLLSNAAKFTPRGSLVEISVGRESRKLRVSVRDSGAGIPQEFQSRVFEKFSQADSSDTRARGGSGLGLSISKTIVEKHGGTIGFVTETGIGTVFFFELPDWQIGAAEAKPEIEDVNPETLRLLVCEDDHDIARLLRMMLEQNGYVVDVAHNAEQAKQCLQERSYAAMTLDLALPGKDGIAFIRELRADPVTCALPIVVVSAHAAEGRTRLNGGFAVVDWLGKPIEPLQLIASIQRAVQSLSRNGLNILHVDDDVDVLRLVAKAVQDLAEIDAASTLAEARVKLALTRYHLVILDLQLSDGSGWDLLPLLRACDSPPAVLVFSDEDISEAEARQVSATLVKAHITTAELINTVRAMVQQVQDTALPDAPAMSGASYPTSLVKGASQIREKRQP